MIKVESLSKSFADKDILVDLSLEIQDGEIIALLGESGTGKSVLLKNLMGLIKPDSGRVFIDGVDITQLREKDLLPIRKKIGYLFQEGALYDFMNVFDNIAFPLREHTKLSKKEIEKKVKDMLSLVSLEGVDRKLPSELSGGMKKRVALARSIIAHCKILFCDEPTSGLDPIRSRDISDLIKKVSNTMGCTTIITSHDIRNAFRIADRALLLKNGRVAAFGKKEDFESSTDPFVQSFMN